MTVRLSIAQAAWQQHVTATAEAYGAALVPVVKGNGYGFGRPLLHKLAGELIGPVTDVCVGNVHELVDVPADVRPIVLTPTLVPPIGESAAVLTVGNTDHVEALRGGSGEVMVKLASSMRRFGATIDELPTLMRAVENLGLGVAGYGLHLPLAGSDEDRVAEIAAWLPHLSIEVPLWVSHLEPATLRALQTKYLPRRFKVRVGTALWHGIPKLDDLRLRADVLHTQPIGVGEIAGYHHTRAPFDGTLVVIGAGSAHGVAANGSPSKQELSPFHFARNRMALLERPHMHTSMVVVAAGSPTPQVGDWVDLQRPLITTQVEDLEWT
ncbi:MAG: alanine racemase [Actinomycetia bacterium]|nr:alanine racemase [Actinomycetes bacterium]